MASPYLQDNSVAEEGALYKTGSFLSNAGKGLFSAAAITSVALLPFALLGGVITTGIVLGGAVTIATAATYFAGTLGAVSAVGGALKGAAAIGKGNTAKGVKEVLKGLVEGAAIVGGAAFVISSGLAAPLMLAGAGILEAGTRVFSGKSVISHIGDVAGALMDAVTPDPAIVNQPSVVQQQRSMAAFQQAQQQPQIQMGQMIPAAGAGYSSVPAGVGYTQQQLAMAPQQSATYWRDRETQGQQQQTQQSGVPMDANSAAQWSQAVADGGRYAKDMNGMAQGATS